MVTPDPEEEGRRCFTICDFLSDFCDPCSLPAKIVWEVSTTHKVHLNSYSICLYLVTVIILAS